MYTSACAVVAAKDRAAAAPVSKRSLAIILWPPLSAPNHLKTTRIDCCSGHRLGTAEASSVTAAAGAQAPHNHEPQRGSGRCRTHASASQLICALPRPPPVAAPDCEIAQGAV